MEKKFILALDQGTTSSRAIVFDHNGQIKSVAQKEFTQYFPQPGWVEHNPNEIWSSQASVIAEAISAIDINGLDIAGIGITNQRETTIVWDIDTEEPIYNAIVWQDRRTAEYCDKLKAQGLTDKIHEKTGLIVDAYFSGTKIKWILDNVPGARKRAEMGKLRFGNVDAWLVWRLTRGEVHVTDVTNASRTMLFNIHDLKWDEDLLKLLDIPLSMMPEVKSSSEIYGHTKTTIFAHEVPISGIAGDQQAALFGQMCIEPGAIKNTYGTGCFVMLNTGRKPVMSKNNLLTTIAWKIGDRVDYALEGSIYVGGSVVQWLRDGLGFITSSSEIEDLASTVPDSGGVYFVPALTGLAAPYWDQYARGTIVGITRGTTRAHIARAALDGIAFQTYDIAQAMAKDMEAPLTELKVDGGASRNNLLMQYQSNLLGIKVVRPKITETTALGAAYLAGLAVGFWKDIDEIKNQWQVERSFEPLADSEEIAAAKAGWADAIGRTLTNR
ncbi:glycerol kinase GlpK [Prevotella denticola]|uniref:glycerol kinase GlpK n=1 Tax=Prevotella denticola TaxID=28129 RepID=UPI001BA8C4B7|nr:glycerol kinase GlpK [Prevotella denticola]MBF1388412.1 glycerol kinase GlpK [Prevotella denticola]MBW4714145.1 glycerol kinase GlpK [Prevotella denticola]MBW4752003.1 glycerol kinase GlpK [Prevotella denticola]MBW4759797.1 glycerol kinase GlpK [Prevotella denticola]MBW4898616.1 glycerol kinase GlpK [Prevotella denticola]